MGICRSAFGIRYRPLSFCSRFRRNAEHEVEARRELANLRSGHRLELRHHGGTFLRISDAAEHAVAFMSLAIRVNAALKQHDAEREDK